MIFYYFSRKLSSTDYSDARVPGFTSSEPCRNHSFRLSVGVSTIAFPGHNASANEKLGSCVPQWTWPPNCLHIRNPQTHCQKAMRIIGIFSWRQIKIWLKIF